ncbi:MAG: flagellar FlbD family protein [Oscillospiraceae bacterium]|nr:flagellar FlbD family protein [Oscillospiraceae bacterium]
MIFLTKLDGKQFLLNENLIETVSETPDTVITLSNGHSYIVRESMKELQTKILEYNRNQRRRMMRRRTADDAEPLT